MKALEKLEQWADTHHPKWIDIVRIFFGLFIFYKGISFIQNNDALMSLMQGSMFAAFAKLSVIHFIAFAHLVGGILIAAGLITRVAVIFQLPILIGAVILNLFQVNFPQGFDGNAELELSIMTLLLLIVFLFYGSGKVSLDEYIRSSKSKEYA